MPESGREEIAKLEALYASNPGGRVFTHLAEAYRKAGELERARATLEEGLTNHPGYASAHVVLGRVLLDLQDRSAAASAFKQVLELDPHNMVALRSLADLARAEGRNEDALQYFHELRQHDPTNFELDDAIAELTAAVAAAPAAEPEYAAAEAPDAVEYDAAGESPPEAPSRFGEFSSDASTLPENGWQPAAETSESGADADLELDWLKGGEVESAGFQELTLPHAEAETADDSFGLSGEIGDIESIGAATQEEEVESVPIEDLTLQPLPPAEPVSEEPGGEVLTETIAELYRAQGLYDRAADVYRALLRERPGDAALEEMLQEVESLGRGEPEASAPEEAPWDVAAGAETTPEPQDWEAPFAADEALHAELSAEADFGAAPEPYDEPELAEAWLAGADATAASTPTPYAWTEQSSEAEETGAPIGQYFTRLLEWRPREAPGAAAESPAAVAEEAAATEEEPVLVLDEPAAEPEPAQESSLDQVGEASPPPVADAEPPTAEEPVGEQPPAQPQAEQAPLEAAAETALRLPAAQAPAASVWEEAASPPEPGAAAESEPRGDAGEAFEAWFDAGEPAAHDAAPPPRSVSAEEEDDDDDLEMFRSWLQSLKK